MIATPATVGDVFPTGLHWKLTVHPPESVVELPALSPLGLAMFHALVSPDPWIGDPVEPQADAWVARYGLPTACEAATRLLGLRPEGRIPEPEDHPRSTPESRLVT